MSFTYTFKDDTAVKGARSDAERRQHDFLIIRAAYLFIFKLQTEIFRLAQVSPDAGAQKEIVVIKK